MVRSRAQRGVSNHEGGPELAKTALPAEAFVAFIREPPNDIPAYAAAVLSDKAAGDIDGYLQSLPGLRTVKDISDTE
jgi:mono/diheme cytochrome c family protein